MSKQHEAFVYGNQDLPTKLEYQIQHECAKRIRCIYKSLQELASERPLPDTTFLVCIGDSHDFTTKKPIFVMSRLHNEEKILFPDFDALSSRYQVIDGIDLETTDFPIAWEDRDERIVWRGRTNQKGGICEHNKTRSPRWHICQLSREYPDLIDAGFTRIAPHSSPSLQEFLKPFLSTKQLFSYKYQAWLDGGVSSYSNSGWRFYTGATVIKSDSDYVQWYFADMEPWVHYVPIKRNLSDLVEALIYLKEHDGLAKQIAQNGLEFVRGHITKETTHQYFHDLLWAYAALDKTSSCPIHGQKPDMPTPSSMSPEDASHGKRFIYYTPHRLERGSN